ncbi:MAG: hypothetical protein KC636_04935 [Myxococcales bacterium]|nr:hypothetical protein [Myxococcales bacterium]
MKVEEKEFSVSFSEADRSIRLIGSMRLRNAKDYDSIKRLLRDAHALDFPRLTLDFRKLEYLNSCALGIFAQFVVEARRVDRTKLVLFGSSRHHWQTRSLGTLKRIWPEITVHID